VLEIEQLANFGEVFEGSQMIFEKLMLS